MRLQALQNATENVHPQQDMRSLCLMLKGLCEQKTSTTFWHKATHTHTHASSLQNWRSHSVGQSQARKTVTITRARRMGTLLLASSILGVAGQAASCVVPWSPSTETQVARRCWSIEQPFEGIPPGLWVLLGCLLLSLILNFYFCCFPMRRTPLPEESPEGQNELLDARSFVDGTTNTVLNPARDIGCQAQCTYTRRTATPRFKVLPANAAGCSP